MGPPIPAGATGRPGGYAAVPSPFSMDEETFRDLGHRLVDTLAAYLDRLPQEPVYRPLPAEARRELEKMDIPAEPVPAEEVIESFMRLVLPYGRGQNHPCFAAFVDPAASKLSMLSTRRAERYRRSSGSTTYQLPWPARSTTPRSRRAFNARDACWGWSPL
jgi:hypothetical protein